jgi:hypothetical protein
MSESFFSSSSSKFKTTIVFLFIAASLGLTLRLIQGGAVPGHFKHILHTHSHIALLGWLYNAGFVLIQYVILNKKGSPLNTVFWLSQLTFLGMLFSFPVQGYAFASITFSTLYLFCSYALVYYLFRYSNELDNKAVAGLLKWSGVYLVFSSIGPFALGLIMAKGLNDTYWYKLSIYWFLHFLYNGFFALIVFAYLIQKLKSSVNQNAIYRLMAFSVIPLYTLSVLWLAPNWSLYLAALMGSVFQLMAFYLLLKEPNFKKLFENKVARQLFGLAIAAYALKMIFQVVSVLPTIQVFLLETVSYSVIGFIHLVMLGFFTLFFFALFIESKFLKMSVLVKVGLQLLVAGILLSEGLLFMQSIAIYWEVFHIPNFFIVLYWCSSLMPIGIGLMVISFFKK